MYTLGLSAYTHESSCALLKGNRVVCVLEEERFNREKNTSHFPIHAIKESLSIAGISMEDINQIAFFWNPVKEISGNIMHMVRYFPKSLNLLRVKSSGGHLSFFKRIFYSSSACVYPIAKQKNPKVTALKEDDAYPGDPDNEYGWEKLFSE